MNRRLWVAGQRLHHGATGMALLSVAAAQLLVNREPSSRSRRLAWLIAGGALCAHDWKDRGVWFQRGPQD